MNKYTQTLGKLCLGIVLALGLTEALLQLASLYQKRVHQAPQEAQGDENLIRILTLGESTTAPDPKAPENSWPLELQRLFDQNKDRVRVYNLAVPATSSNLIVARLPEQLERYRPHIVISMMGINDSNLWLMQKEERWVNHFMIYKIATWIFSSLKEDQKKSQALATALKALPEKDYSSLRSFKTLRLLWQKSHARIAAREQTLSALKDFSPGERAQFLTSLANSLLPGPQEKPENFYASYELYQLSLANYFWVHSTVENLSYTLAILRKDQECFDLAERFIQQGGELNDFILTMFSFCSTQSATPSKWSRIFEKLPYQFDLKIHQERLETTKKNYRRLHEILNLQKIKLVAMQYPLVKLSTLHFYFQQPPFFDRVYPPYDNITFVSNENNFKKALQQKKYEDLFTDRFAIDFGHATSEGNKLIAQEVYQVTLPLIKSMQNSHQEARP